MTSETKLVVAIEQKQAVEGEGTKDNTPQYSCISPVADASCDFENDIQKIVDNNLNHERCLKFEHPIQNAIAVYKQLYQEVSQT